MALGFMRRRKVFQTGQQDANMRLRELESTRSRRLHTAKAEVVGPGIDFALAARAHDVAGAILLVAEKGTTFVDALFLRRLGGIEGALREVSEVLCLGPVYYFSFSSHLPAR